MTMLISDAGVDFIVSFEGKLKPLGDGRYTSYKCPAGVWSIYTGCTEGVVPGMVVTEDEGRQMFRRELAKHETAVLKLAKVPLSQAQFDALVSFSYNVGSGALGKSTLLRHLNSGDYARAASHFADYKYGGGRVLPGLVRRRAAEAEMFLRNDDTAMAQKVDAPSFKMRPVEAVMKVGGPAGALMLLLEYLGGVVNSAVGALSSVEPIKAAAIQAGGNAKAIGLAVLAFAAFAGLGALLRAKQ